MLPLHLPPLIFQPALRVGRRLAGRLAGIAAERRQEGGLGGSRFQLFPGAFPLQAAQQRCLAAARAAQQDKCFLVHGVQ